MFVQYLRSVLIFMGMFASVFVFYNVSCIIGVGSCVLCHVFCVNVFICKQHVIDVCLKGCVCVRFCVLCVLCVVYGGDVVVVCTIIPTWIKFKIQSGLFLHNAK